MILNLFFDPKISASDLSCLRWLQETGLGLEHHLHRGRALSAFNRLLTVRAQNLKSEESGELTQGQTNIQSDLQRLLAPLTENEISLLSSVRIFAFIYVIDLCYEPLV